MVKGYAAAATALLALSGVNSFGKCHPFFFSSLLLGTSGSIVLWMVVDTDIHCNEVSRNLARRWIDVLQWNDRRDTHINI